MNASETVQQANVTPTSKSRSLDHFVIQAADITTAAEAYCRMGFQVMDPMEHAEIGTSNVIIQLADTYLEIIGDFDHCRVPHLRDAMAPWFAQGDGYWQTSLTSSGLEADRERLEAKGLAPEQILSARRRFRLPEGGWTETDSRSCYIWNKREPLMSLFMSDHRRPEAIFVPGYRCHPNGATRVSAVRYVAADPPADLDYIQKIVGAEPVQASEDGVVFATPRNETLEIRSEAAMAELMPGALGLPTGATGRGVGFVYRVESLQRCRAVLRRGGVPHVARDAALIVPASHGCGMAIEFREESEA